MRKIFAFGLSFALLFGVFGLMKPASTYAQEPSREQITGAASGSTGSAIVNTSVSALEVAQSMTGQAGLVTGAAFSTVPAANTTAGVSTTAYPAFPLEGGSYAVLSTGYADMTSISEDLGGGHVRGNTDYDVTILMINLDVPASDNCLSFDFRFLSREWPAFVGSEYNDAFIAEVGASTWTTSGSTISAPNNFAVDPNGNVVSINATGPALMNSANAAITPFSAFGASGVVRARTPIGTGAQVLYLSIFDQGDHVLDSVVFLDNLLTFATDPSECVPGITDTTAVEAGQSFCRLPLTANAVVGEIISPTRIYWGPGAVSPTGSIEPGMTYWVLGVDESGEYYKLWYECTYIWVPVGVVAPAYGDPVWNGAPLPTNVVS